MSGSNSSIKHRRHQAVLLLVSVVRRCMTPQCLRQLLLCCRTLNTHYLHPQNTACTLKQALLTPSKHDIPTLSEHYRHPQLTTDTLKPEGLTLVLTFVKMMSAPVDVKLSSNSPASRHSLTNLRSTSEPACTLEAQLRLQAL